jgi:hypothetical protein
VNTQLHVLRVVFAAAAAFVIFLVVNTALDAFSGISNVLTGS